MVPRKPWDPKRKTVIWVPGVPFKAPLPKKKNGEGTREPATDPQLYFSMRFYFFPMVFSPVRV